MKTAIIALFYAFSSAAVATAFHIYCGIAFGSLRANAAPATRDLRVEPISRWPERNQRWALVIGVDQYKDAQIGPLRGAANDAKTLAEALIQHAGFAPEQVILLATDQPEERQPTRVNILRRLSNLSHVVPTNGLLLVFFAGHGMERNGQAFLLPSDAQINNDLAFLEETGLSVTKLHEKIRATHVEQVIVLLDACRNDPVGRSGTPNVMSTAYVDAFKFDVLNREVKAFATMYAAQVGQKAYEYAEKKQGYFTWAVVEGLKGAAADEKGRVTLANLTRYVEEIVPKLIGVDLGFVSPQSPFTEIAGYRATDLVVAFATRGGSEPNLPIPVSEPSPPELAVKESSRRPYLNPRDQLQYIWVPPGDFDMGCAPKDADCQHNEKPQHHVFLQKGFYITESPVTVSAFKRFAAATGRPMPPEPGFSNGKLSIPAFNPGWSLEDHPIVNVGWAEAQQYCEWIGGRLPFESEWEYSAKGGHNNTRYPWGDTISREHANYGRVSCCGGQAEAEDRWDYTSPVARFPSNGFGLFDMTGNVYQWVADWFHADYYGSSPTIDPKGPPKGEYRIARGGSWSDRPSYLRVSNRYVVPQRARNHYIGFRCAID